MAKRNLWRPELPLPPSLRWIPADAAVFRGSHSGVGRNSIFRLRQSVPGELRIRRLHRLPRCSSCASTQTARRRTMRTPRAIAWTSPSSAAPALAVWTIGDVRNDSVSVCEGAADALALAAREPDPVIATLSTPRPVLDWERQLAIFDFVTLWPDMDEEDEQGRRPGLDAATALAQARKLAGRVIEVMGVDIGKDAADAAIATPFGDIDMDELNRFAADLQAEGTETFEAMRYASTLLK